MHNKGPEQKLTVGSRKKCFDLPPPTNQQLPSLAESGITLENEVADKVYLPVVEQEFN